MTTFKFRKKEYEVTRDSRQFILSRKQTTSDGLLAYSPIGYYKDPFFLIQKLASLHLVKPSDAKELTTSLRKLCKDLGNVINKAVKATPTGLDSTID